MKTLYLTASSDNIWVDPETDEVGKLDSEDRYEIRNVYYMEEPMHIVYQYGERKEEIDAKKGEILLVFYDNKRNKHILDTIRTKQWVANMKNARKIDQLEKEEWAAKQTQCDCKCDYDNACCPVPETEAPVKDTPVKKIKKALKKIVKAKKA